MADRTLESDHQSKLSSVDSGSAQDVQAAREDLEALKEELKYALAQKHPAAASCDDTENSQLHQVCTCARMLTGLIPATSAMQAVR